MRQIGIGIIYPSDGAFDREFWEFAPPDVSLHFTRAGVPEKPITLDLLDRLLDDGEIERAAHTLRLIHPAAVAYACTSVSFVRGMAGNQALIERIGRVAGCRATTTSAAIVAACRAMGLKRVAVAAPYLPEITARLVSFLSDHAIDVLSVRDLGLSEGIAGVTREDVLRLGLSVDTPEAGGIIIACTNLATVSAISTLERQVGKPVITANQATVWHACRMAGVRQAEGAGIGTLWRLGEGGVRG